MAAIIDFPTEAAVWRRRNSSRREADDGSRGKILIFSGIRYSRGKKAGGRSDRKPEVKGVER